MFRTMSASGWGSGSPAACIRHIGSAVFAAAARRHRTAVSAAGQGRHTGGTDPARASGWGCNQQRRGRRRRQQGSY